MALGWLTPDEWVRSPRARPKALSAWHSPDYVAAVMKAEEEGSVSDEVRRRYNLGTHANPVFAEMYRRPATAAGAAIWAGENLKDGGVLYSPAGGTHHGMPDHANGFCYFNDPVLAILSMREYGVQRIAYVDIDAHHPDGVEHAFATDPDVLMISVHEERRWPFKGHLEDRGVGNVFNLPVPRGFNDAEMRAAREDIILPLVQAFRPEAIILQCGADAVTEDPLSRLALSNNAHWAIVEALNGMAPRYLVLGGGGYNPWSVGRLWTGVWGTLTKQKFPERLPPLAEAVLRDLSWPGRAAGRNPPEHWFTTICDLPREGQIKPEVRERLDALGARMTAWL
ncbi:Acetoin utilization protein AcuC [Boseongicola aestuarii]|uniref:Acetoin utilization protein AcuC n=2 Tax=Boseongicola aestuarii TaxID=1470561 RepID=A0A238IY71_9RHOB|nr:Acetoin utilization protein AcuC [Boseongicola aestuarii]